MIVYYVFDGEEYEETFPTRYEAVHAARQNNASVWRLTIGKMNRKMVCKLLNQTGYAMARELIFTYEGTRT
jgi:hypothetical protein